MECKKINATGKVKEQTYEMTRYKWHISSLCEVRWKDFGETTTEEGHKIYYSGKENKHEHRVGFLIHKTIVGSVLGCRPISSRLISLRLRASPFNITITQVYAPTTSYDNNKVETFYNQLQEILDETWKRTSWLHNEIGMQKLERKHQKTGMALAASTATPKPTTEASDFKNSRAPMTPYW